MTRILCVGMLCFLVVFGAFAQTPPAPTNLTAEQIGAGGGTTNPAVRLAWQSEQGSWAFRVYRSANDTSHFQPIGMANSRTFVDYMVTVNTRYYYFVKAVSGNLESGRSNVVNILITPPPPPTPPPTPTNLVASLVPGGPNTWGVAVKLAWHGPRGPWSFKISRSANDTSHFQNAGTTSDTQFVDFGVHDGTRYFYYVRAVTGNAESGRSNVVDILVVAPPRLRGTIRGTVIDDSTSAPIRGVAMQFFRSSNAWYPISPVVTDSLGRYSALLDTGRYIVRANPLNCGGTTIRYRAEYFDNCTEPACATVIAVAESSIFTANFGLARIVPPSYANVSGTVTDTLNNPLRHARVSVIRTMQEMNFLASLGMVPGIGPEAMDLEGVGHTHGVVWSGYTDSLGNYRARVIANQSYIALASKETFLPEYYNNKRTIETADVILVTHDTSGINFSLELRPVPNNSVSGRVQDSAGTGVPSRIVVLPARHNHPTPNAGRYGHTDSLGNYTIGALEAGRYFVLAIPFSNYAPGFYKANACRVLHIQDADTVDVNGNVTNINICVGGVRNNGLSLVRGRIRSTANVSIAGVRVTAINTLGEILGIGMTDAVGAYELNAVAPGAVTVIADCDGYSPEQLGVVVSPNVFTVDNVNITMSPSSPTAVGNPDVVPERFALDQNYPNPFNPSTKISYALSAPGAVTLTVFNVLGQEVATLVHGNLAAGSYTIVWNGTDNLGRPAASGVYLYKLQATAGPTEFTQVRKMLLVK